MKSMNRRSFLKYQAAGMLWTIGAPFMFPGRLFAQEKTDIAVVNGEIQAAVRKSVEMLGGISKFVKKGDRVVIKPNMSFAVSPERASNTHPLVAKTVAAMCKEAGAARVLVLDNPLAPAEQCLEASGIYAACESLEKDMVHMVSNPGSFKEVGIPNGRTLKTTDVMKEVLSADVLIAAPVAKSHSGAGVSLSMKGMMGLIRDRSTMHRRGLHETIVDLVSLLTPQLVIIDATRVLTTGGPGGPGKVIEPKTIIAAADMVAADAYAVSAFEWYGKTYAPSQIKHIRLAHERGLGRMDIENLNVKKTSV
jgi:uncharacterized protein (DUF362 family)